MNEQSIEVPEQATSKAPEGQGVVERVQTMQWCSYCQAMVQPYVEAGAGGTGDSKTDVASRGGSTCRCPSCKEFTKPAPVAASIASVAAPLVGFEPPPADSPRPGQYVEQIFATGPTGIRRQERLAMVGLKHPVDTFDNMATSELAAVESQLASLKSRAKALRKILGR